MDGQIVVDREVGVDDLDREWEVDDFLTEQFHLAMATNGHLSQTIEQAEQHVRKAEAELARMIAIVQQVFPGAEVVDD